MTSLDFGPEMKYIGYQAFMNCPNLTKINSQNTVPPTLDSPCFDQSAYASVALTVPQQSIDAYKAAAEWKEFNNINGYVAVDAVNADGNIKINGREIAVNDSNAFVEIYGLSGNTVYSGVPAGNTITLTEGGIYIIRLNGKSIKISVK